MKLGKKAAGVLAATILAHAAAARGGVEVSGAWARATLPGQKVAGVYMQVKSDAQARLVGVNSPAAKSAEVHEMRNEGGVMRMRRLDSVDLPAGRVVKLEPGGYHVMLFDIRRPLKVGEQVKLTLLIRQERQSDERSGGGGGEARAGGGRARAPLTP